MSGCYLNLGVSLEPEEHVQVAASSDNLFSADNLYSGDNYFFAAAFAPEYNISILAERFNFTEVGQNDQTIQYLLVNKLIIQKIAELKKQPENFELTAQDFRVHFEKKQTPLPEIINSTYQKMID